MIPQYAKFRIIDNIGKIKHIDVTFVPIHQDDNEVIGFYGLTHNISDEQEMQRVIQNKRDKISLIDPLFS